MNEWLIASGVLLLALIPCGIATFRGSPMERLLGLEMAGVIETMFLITFAIALATCAKFSGCRAGDGVALLSEEDCLLPFPGALAMTRLPSWCAGVSLAVALLTFIAARVRARVLQPPALPGAGDHRTQRCCSSPWSMKYGWGQATIKMFLLWASCYSSTLS